MPLYKIAIIFGSYSPRILSGIDDIDPEGVYYGPLLRSFVSAVGQSAEIQLVHAQDDYAEFAARSQFDAYLLLSTEFTELDKLSALYDAGVTFVSIGASPDQGHLHLPIIDCANRDGGACAAEYLLAQGHTELACINLASDHMDQSDRLHGFLGAAAAAGHAIDTERILLEDEYRYDIFDSLIGAWLSRLQSRGKLPTAIFATDFNMTDALLGVLDARGIRIPLDISIIGFDDPPAASHSTPPLTTIRQPVERMGIRAAERILAALDAPSGRTAIHGVEILPTEIVIRGSVDTHAPS